MEIVIEYTVVKRYCASLWCSSIGSILEPTFESGVETSCGVHAFSEEA